MKILLLITKGEIGGAQVFVANLAKGLKNKLCGNDESRVEIACGEGDFLFNFAKKENIVIHRLKSLKRSSGFFSNINFFFSFISFIKKNKFEVLHLNSTNTLIGAISAKIANRKIKIIFTVHGLSILDPNYEAGVIKKFLYKLFFKFCFLFVDKVVFVSQNNLDLAKKIKLVKNGYLIYNGVDTDYLSRDEARKFLFDRMGVLDNDKFLIGSIGRLAYPKNYEFLISIFDKIIEIEPRAHLVLIGDGPERGRYEALIGQKKLENRIFLLGEIEMGTRYLKGLDLFILPSIYEGLSISLIEALNSGISVMASNVGGNEEIIGVNNCYRLDDSDDFLNVFNKIIDVKVDSYKNRNNYNVRRNEFLAINMMEKYLDLYKKYYE
ncbi:MAG: glycosyltransferase family 4 protein [Patescibacteria group bacterium]|nr:glycosyltransferase family 4 protein [Patescibacteria group bacterium]